MIVQAIFFMENKNIETKGTIRKVYPKEVDFEFKRNGFNMLIGGTQERVYPREFLFNSVINNEMNTLDFYSKNLLRKVVENDEIISSTITYEASLQKKKGYIVEVLMNLKNNSLEQYNFETQRRAQIYFS